MTDASSTPGAPDGLFGLDLTRILAARAEVRVEGFRPEGLAKYGRDHATQCKAGRCPFWATR